MAWMLIWAVVVMTSAGIKTGNVTDSTTFKSEKECTEFAQSHKARMEDWVRGSVGVGWNAPVRAEPACTVAGQPA